MPQQIQWLQSFPRAAQYTLQAYSDALPIFYSFSRLMAYNDEPNVAMLRGAPYENTIQDKLSSFASYQLHQSSRRTSKLEFILSVLTHFIGSEESIMELEGSHFDNVSDVEALTQPNTVQLPPVMGSVTLQIEHWERRLRNSNLTPPAVLYRIELPERSQSSLSLVNSNQLASPMTNQLGAQQGLHVRDARKLKQEVHLTITEALMKRRSRSADSRIGQCRSARRRAAEKARTRQNATPSTSRASERVADSQQLPVADIKIQVNGDGVEI